MILKITLKHLLKYPVSTLLTVVAISAALTLLGSFWTMVENLERIKLPKSTQAADSKVLPGLTLFASPNLSAVDIGKLKTQLEQDKRFKSIEVVSSEDAMKSLENQFGETLSKVFEHDKLPISIKLQFADGTMTRDELLGLYNSLRSMTGVLDVDDGLSLIPTEKTSLSSRLFSWATGLLLLVFVVVALLVSHMIRLAFEPLRAELETLQILGASKTWIFMPLLCEGLFFGFIGAVGAMTLLWVAINVVLPVYAPYLLPKGLEVMSLSLKASFGLITLGVLSSLVGTFLTWPLVNRSSLEVR